MLVLMRKIANLLRVIQLHFQKNLSIFYPTCGKESINHLHRGWRTDQPAQKFFQIGPVVAEVLKVTTRWETLA